MAYLLAGPAVALIGIVAVFFVLRRKSVDKRSMYSARRSQIEHKVRAARQRTLTPHGRAPRPSEETIPAGAATTAFAQQAPQATVTWERPAYEPPPAAPLAPPPPPKPDDMPSQAPWDLPAAASAPAPTFDYPPAPAQPAYTPQPFQPAPEPAPRAAPSEPAWTPAPAPASEPARQMEPIASTASATAAGGWSVVSTDKQSAELGPEQSDGKKKRKDKAGAATDTPWQLASGDAPGAEAGEEMEVTRSSGTVMAVAQYAVLVVGLVMVLIGVLVMVANSHVT